MYGVAFRNGIDFRDLAAWNGIGAPYTIYPGQSLRLYPSVAERCGDRRKPATTCDRRPSLVPPPFPPKPVATAPATRAREQRHVLALAGRWRGDRKFAAGDATKQGVDIAGTSGQPVRAAGDGVVVYSGGGLVGYGELIIVKHSEAGCRRMATTASAWSTKART